MPLEKGTHQSNRRGFSGFCASGRMKTVNPAYLGDIVVVIVEEGEEKEENPQMS